MRRTESSSNDPRCWLPPKPSAMAACSCLHGRAFRRLESARQNVADASTRIRLRAGRDGSVLVAQAGSSNSAKVRATWFLTAENRNLSKVIAIQVHAHYIHCLTNASQPGLNPGRREKSGGAVTGHGWSKYPHSHLRNDTAIARTARNTARNERPAAQKKYMGVGCAPSVSE